MEKVKKIVLIGASGFVGSALLNEALNRGFEVTAVVRHPEKIKPMSPRLMKWLPFVRVQMLLLVHSIRDGIILIYTMKQSKFI